MSNADTDREGRNAIFRNGQLSVDLLDLGRDQMLLHLTGMNHEDDEFITADSADLVIGTKTASEDLYQSDQSLITDLMAMIIIDTLEVIHIE